VSSIPFTRFRGIVLPDDRLLLSSFPREGGGTRFEVRRAGALVANGALTFGGARTDDHVSHAVAVGRQAGAPPLHDLIPHRPPMLFVDRILGEADDGATCRGRVPEAFALVREGRVPALVALEVAAQTAAVWEALRRSREPGSWSVRTGYLVSIKDVVLHRRTIEAEVDLIASIRLEASMAELTTYAVDVSVEGGQALSGTIGTYLGD
jgi:predicted hotdog family 3-hydroxylacyl-ACP dehydratase